MTSKAEMLNLLAAVATFAEASPDTIYAGWDKVEEATTNMKTL